MAIEQIQIRGFRSIRDLTLPLQQLNVVSGPNGCGKSNLYKAVRLLHEAASGRLALRWPRKAAFRKRCGPVAYDVAIVTMIRSG